MQDRRRAVKARRLEDVPRCLGASAAERAAGCGAGRRPWRAASAIAGRRAFANLRLCLSAVSLDFRVGAGMLMGLRLGESCDRMTGLVSDGHFLRPAFAV